MKTVTLPALLGCTAVFFTGLLLAPPPASAQAASASSADMQYNGPRFFGAPSTGSNSNPATTSYDTGDDYGDYCVVPNISVSSGGGEDRMIPVTPDVVTSASGASGGSDYRGSRVLDWDEAVALGSSEEPTGSSGGANATNAPSTTAPWVTSDDDSYEPSVVLDWDEAVQLGYQEQASMAPTGGNRGSSGAPPSGKN